MTKARGQQKARKRATDKRPYVRTVTFYLDSEVVEAYNDAVRLEAETRTALDAVSRSDNSEANARALERWHAAVEALEEAEAAKEDERLDVKLRAIPRERYLAMLALPEHKATQEHIDAAFGALEAAGQLEQLTEAQRKQFTLSFNPDTFPKALVRACATELDDEEIEAIFDPQGTWSQEDVTALFHAAEDVCQKASWIRR